MRLTSKLRDKLRPSAGTSTKDHADYSLEEELGDQIHSEPGAQTGSRQKLRLRDRVLRRNRRQPDSGEGEDPAAVSLLDDQNPFVSEDLATDNGLDELLAAEVDQHGTATASSILEDDRWLDDGEDQARREDARPVTFDTRATTLFEPVFRVMLLAGLVCLVLVAIYGVNQARMWLTAEGSPTSQTGTVLSGAEASDSPSQRAGDLAEDFTRDYLAYPPAEDDQATEDHLAALQPYLHPDADPDLFASAAGEDTQGAQVSYASARNVESTPGEDRYKVLVDARLQTPDDQEGSTTRTLTVYLQVPETGGQAYVIAPPRMTESSVEDEAGLPGIYGYPDARTLENDPALKSTLEDFLDALYAPIDSRPLIKEEMEPGASVASFPPQSHTYEGIERAAIYYRDDLAEAESQGYASLYDVEIYVRVTDEETGATSLDSWALTVGQTEEGDYTITRVF